MKFEVGDKVRITKNNHSHEFDIGEIVTISYVGLAEDDTAEEDKNKLWYKANDDDFFALTGEPVQWFFDDSECEAMGCECCSADNAVYRKDNDNNAFVDSNGEMLVTINDHSMRFKIKYCPVCGRKF